MIPLSTRKHFNYYPNVCLLVLILTVLMAREAMSATGYKPSTFQEEKGDFPNVPRNGPFQRTHDQKTLSKWNEYKGHGRTPPSKKSGRQGNCINIHIDYFQPGHHFKIFIITEIIYMTIIHF